MYKTVIRPILFLLPPENVHKLIVSLIRFAFKIPGLPRLIGRIYKSQTVSAEKKVMGITFPNPVGLAAGFDKDAAVFREFAHFGFGFIEIGTVTPKPQPGNPKPRSFRLPKDKALINRMGFNNAGVEAAVEKLKKRESHLIIGGNIGKNTLTPNSEAVNDYEFCFTRLYDYVDYFVVNVSCPNITDLHELQDQDMLMGILKRLVDIRKNEKVHKPILLKISPDLNWNQVDESIKIVRETGIEGFVATNTTVSRENLSTPGAMVDEIGRGGLSGVPIRERATEVIRYLREKSGRDKVIIGVGGIMTPGDALEKTEAGADLVQVYTGFIYEGPALVKRILREFTGTGS